ncbi:uncharacterized transmembrane DDB_G0293028 isoform X1 [Olea europaea subsp. europaea]|uniref:Uncharacterized transmembrane DDB_G0293028 isoform X1 n=1 Tax=Olea europaea subsp. europaea TaxID=158383 RepID=A0A8S0TQ00_OLEEU|nr:uncharacterized transmembrane DDB_G0293028 isoform X1 [Olea europaea subsp. europaea]
MGLCLLRNQTKYTIAIGKERRAMRSVVSRIGVRLLTEGNWRSSALGLRHSSDGSGRVLSEEERAKETVYVQKMERERAEKMKKKMEQEKADNDKSDKAEE